MAYTHCITNLLKFTSRVQTNLSFRLGRKFKKSRGSGEALRRERDVLYLLGVRYLYLAYEVDTFSYITDNKV